MRRNLIILILLISIAALIGVILPQQPLSGVYTNNNNNARTGTYYETILNPNNVNAGAIDTFGKLHTWEVEGQIYAQPLYVRWGNRLGGRRQNVVYVATQKNWVYAFDADTYATLWSRPLGDPIHLLSDVGCNSRNLYPWIGVTSTPVIDPEAETIYLITHNKEDGNYFHRLHALDLRTGEEKFGGSVDITASVPGVGDEYDHKDGAIIVFDRHEQPDRPRQLNRPGILLWNGLLYVAFGSYCDDKDKYHGWVMAYDAQSLQQKWVYNATPGGGRGGIWQSGRGLVADFAGNIFFMTGNGEVRVDRRSTNLGHSFVRLRHDLKFPDWFTPRKHACRNHYDLDLGASGPLLITARSGALADNRIVGGGKDGSFYLLKAMDMGKGQDQGHEPLDEIIATHEPEWQGIECFSLPKDQLWTYYPQVGTKAVHHIHGGPVLWDKFNDGQELIIYLLGENDPLKAFRFRNNQLEGPIARSKYHAPPGMPGGTLSLSYSEDPNNSLIWVNIPLDRGIMSDAVESIVEGYLIAFQALPLQHPEDPNRCESTPDKPCDLKLWWHSEIAPNHRDSVGLYAKFVPPTIAGGKVFVASFGDPQVKDDENRKGWLHVYGLGQPPPPSPTPITCGPCESGFICEDNICQDCSVVCEKRLNVCLADLPQNASPAMRQAHQASCSRQYAACLKCGGR